MTVAWGVKFEKGGGFRYPNGTIGKTSRKNSFPWQSSFFNKLFSTIHTVFVLVAPVFWMFLLTTSLRRDIPIHHIPTHRTKVHRHASTSMVSVGARTVLNLFIPFCQKKGTLTFSEETTILVTVWQKFS